MGWAKRLAGTKEEATALVFAAMVHEQRQEREPAKNAYLAALQLNRASHDSKKAADCLYRLFYLSWRASAHRDAFTFATQAVEEAGKAGDRTQGLTALEGLFTSLFEIGDLPNAKHVVDQIEGLLAENDRPARIRFLLHRSALYLADSRVELARSSLEEALALTAAGDKNDLLNIHFNLAEVALLLGDLGAADTHLNAARQLADLDRADRNHQAALAFYQSWLDYERGRYSSAARSVTTVLARELPSDWVWQLQFRLGRAEEARGHSTAAREAYRLAIDSIERQRRSIGNDEFKDWLVNRRRRPFESLFRLNVQAGDASGALAVLEQAKARAFMDAFIHNASTTDARPDAPGTWSVDVAAERLDALHQLFPAEGDSQAARLPAVAQLLKSVVGRHVLVYFEAETQLWVLRVTEGRITSRSLGDANEIRRLVQQFVSRPDNLEVATSLSRRLLPQGWLPLHGSTLYVVPDGVLGTLPFSALRLNDRWLVEGWTISYLPSVSALGALEGAPDAATTTAVVIGDPQGNLPGAQEESRYVASYLGVDAHTGSGATHQTLERSSGAPLLHIAAHTWLGPGGPWLGLADQTVSASTLIRARIRPRIAVLASCSGAASRGTGYWGSWGAAFLAAGTRSVVASLWSVGDDQSREFVHRFYEEGGATCPADGVARAQRVFARAGRPPSFWAPFVHLGSVCTQR